MRSLTISFISLHTKSQWCIWDGENSTHHKDQPFHIRRRRFCQLVRGHPKLDWRFSIINGRLAPDTWRLVWERISLATLKSNLAFQNIRSDRSTTKWRAIDNRRLTSKKKRLKYIFLIEKKHLQYWALVYRTVLELFPFFTADARFGTAKHFRKYFDNQRTLCW